MIKKFILVWLLFFFSIYI